jgi:hypothetical protein
LTPNHTPANGSSSSAGEFGMTSGAQQQYYTPTAMRGGAASTSSVDSEDQVDAAKCSPYRNLRNGLQKVNIVGVGRGGSVHASDGLHQRYQKNLNGQTSGVGVQATTSAVSSTQYTLCCVHLFVCIFCSLTSKISFVQSYK